MSERVQKLFRMYEKSKQRAIKYATSLEAPQSHVGNQVVFRVPKKNLWDSPSSRIQFTVVPEGGDGGAYMASGVYAFIDSYQIHIGGTQIYSCLNASNYLTMKANQRKGNYNNFQRNMFLYGRQMEFEMVDVDGTQKANWTPFDEMAPKADNVTSFDLCLYVKDLWNGFDKEAYPVQMMNDYITITINFKPSASFAKVLLPENGSVTGYSISNPRLVCNFLQLPSEDMLALAERPIVVPYTDVMTTQKPLSASTSTQVNMNLANKHVLNVNLAFPRPTDSELTGDDNSYLSASDGWQFQARINGNQLFTVPVAASKLLYTYAKDASKDSSFYCYAPGCYIDESDGAGGGEFMDTNNYTWGDANTSSSTQFKGMSSWVSFSMQPFADEPLSWDNSTQCDSKPISLQLGHNAGVNSTTPNVLVYVEVMKVLVINPDGGIEVVESPQNI